MSAASKYDAIVIGAGQAGGPLASALAGHGRRTALIEREHVGGTCVNVGCTPTKTMIASARVAHLAHRSVDYGVSTGPVSVDFSVVRERKRRMVKMFHDGSRSAVLKTEGLDLIMGEASFSGDHEVTVKLNDGSTLQLVANAIFIDTGTRPSVPPISGLEDVPYLDSTTIMELDEVPDHLIVIGGGYVGLEFSQMFRRFGADVTIIQRGDQLLSHEDSDIADAVRGILQQDDITIHLGASAEQASCVNGRGVELALTQGSDTFTVQGSHLLIAGGRRPNTDMLDVEQTGLTLDDRGFIPVNDRLETEVKGIYAMGDVVGGPAFTHISYDDFRILRTNLFESGAASRADRVIPYAVFIDPELGRVGLSEREARQQGYSVRVATLPMSSVARALEMDETRGVMKAVVDAESKKILGGAILGVNGGEVMTVLQIAMMTGAPYTLLRDGAFAHPTVAESLNNLFATLDD